MDTLPQDFTLLEIELMGLKEEAEASQASPAPMAMTIIIM